MGKKRVQFDLDNINLLHAALFLVLLIPVGAYKLYSAFKSYRQEQRLAQGASDVISKFVAAYLPNDGRWYSGTSIPIDDIAAFRLVVEKQCGIAVPLQSLIAVTLKEYFLRVTERFVNHLGADVSPNDELDSWIDAYIDQFESNSSNLIWLAAAALPMAKRRLFAQVYAFQGIDDSPAPLKWMDKHIQHVTITYQQRIHMRILSRRALEIQSVLVSNGFLALPDRPSMAEVAKMTGEEFELLLKRLFEAMNFQVATTPSSHDYGGDLVLERVGERTVVQAKRYLGAVPISAVQECFAARAVYGCLHAMVVTNSTFTRSATELAKANHVTLWDREILMEMITSYL